MTMMNTQSIRKRTSPGLPSLTRFAWLSIGAAIVTITLKFSAYLLTGSVGLLSDAVESLVNLFAAITALLMLRLSVKPPDETHLYGHSKAEYFSSIIEGALILVAAIGIGATAVQRLIHPIPLSYDMLGIAFSVGASVVNLSVALVLRSAANHYHSITLEADSKHLLTDVWTSLGVIIAVGVVFVTRIETLDPLIAIGVAGMILKTGFTLIQKSATGLLDVTIPLNERTSVEKILQDHCKGGIQYHDIRTRQAGMRRFISFHVLVPGRWTVKKGHNLLEIIERDIRHAIPHSTIFTHAEPLEDKSSWMDTELDRNDE
jgi:cation diffusion facilitator family transporter